MTMNKSLLTVGLFLLGGCHPAIAQDRNIHDHFKTIYERKPYHVQVCRDVSMSGDKTGDTLKGAIIGGILGNQNSTASGNICRTETRYNEEARTVYSHSTITFVYEGKQYKLNFKK